MDVKGASHKKRKQQEFGPQARMDGATFQENWPTRLYSDEVSFSISLHAEVDSSMVAATLQDWCEF